MYINSVDSSPVSVHNTRQPSITLVSLRALSFIAKAFFAFSLVALLASRLSFAAVENLSIVEDYALTHPVNPVARNFGIWTEATDEGGAAPGTTNDGLIFNKGDFIGSRYLPCFGVRYHHPQHVVRLPNKDGRAYFATTHSDYIRGVNPDLTTFDGGPAGRMTVYKSFAKTDPSTDRVVKSTTPGVADGIAVWEDTFNNAGGKDGRIRWGFNHPGKMQVIGNILLVSMEQWQPNQYIDQCRVDGIGSADDAVFFYDVRDPENPQYWGRLTASELGTGAPINDVEVFQMGDIYVLKVLNKFFTSPDVRPEISGWTEMGPVPAAFGFKEKSQGRVIDSYELYNDNPDWLLGGFPVGGGVPWEPGVKRPIFYNAEEDTSNLVGGDEVMLFQSICINSPSAPQCLRPGIRPVSAPGLVIGIAQPENDNMFHRSAPNINAGEVDYDAGSIYVSGGRPIIYASCIDCGGAYDVISVVYDDRNRYLTLSQALLSPNLNPIEEWSIISQGGDWFANWDESAAFNGDLAQTTPMKGNRRAIITTNISGTGILTFNWKVSSEINDYLRFEIDGNEVVNIPKISGESGWLQRSYAVQTSGNHTLNWIYQKNGSVNGGEDLAYLDGVSFTPSPVSNAYTVTNNSNSGLGSLRYAIDTGFNYIEFDPSLNGATIDLTSPLVLTQFTTILASNLSNGLTLDGNNTAQILKINAGANINGLRIIRGKSVGNGAGIENLAGHLTLVDSTLDGNRADAYGGGIINLGGTVTLQNSTLTNNFSSLGGGALYNGNNAASEVMIINSTLAHNSSDSNGAGIYNYLGKVTLIHTTVARNNASVRTGGINNEGGSIIVNNSIVAENTDNGTAPDFYSTTAIDVNGQNLIGNNAGVSSSFPADEFVGTPANPLNPMLATLTNNGGSTSTLQPHFGSPVIDAANHILIFDQRGEPRAVDPQDDIGAVEVLDNYGAVTNTLDDNSAGSLRVLIADAAIGSTVSFAPALDGKTIVMSSPLELNKNVSISASSLSNGLTLDGNNATRVLKINAGVIASINGLTIARASVASSGAAISNSGGILSVTDSTFVDNHAVAFGGAILNQDGTVTINSSSFVNNSAASGGGAIYNGNLATTTTTVINSMFTGNSSAYGGAFDNRSELTLVHSTVVGNNATAYAGGIYNNGSVNIENSIIAENTDVNNRPDIFTFTPVITTGQNLIGNNFGTSIPPGPLVGTPSGLLNPMLSPFARNGGRTSTMMPLPGSPVIDAASMTMLVDQRQVPRSQGLASDIGSVEFIDNDNDGFDNGVDRFPEDSLEWIDTDRDGTGNNADIDDDNDTILDVFDLAPKRDPLNADWAISAGSFHSCALDDNGVNCWGSNGSGRSTPPITLSNPVAVSAGGNHTCALDDSGVQCWGSNTSLQTDVPVLSNASAVSAGSFHTCAVDDTGVKCWGETADGRTTVPYLSNPTAVSAGESHSCALDERGVTCWGSNTLGQSTVPALSNPIAVSAGDFHSCAIDDSGVKCWGLDNDGQTMIPFLNNPWNLSAGAAHTCAVDENGVKCWGLNNNGQTTLPTLSHAWAVSVGRDHSCALNDGGVKCWGGYNDFGETTVSSLTFDKDQDGLMDSLEDLNGNGQVDVGETDSNDIDSNDNGLVDGENGIVPIALYPSGLDLDQDGFVDGELTVAEFRVPIISRTTGLAILIMLMLAAGYLKRARNPDVEMRL